RGDRSRGWAYRYGGGELGGGRCRRRQPRSARAAGRHGPRCDGCRLAAAWAGMSAGTGSDRSVHARRPAGSRRKLPAAATAGLLIATLAALAGCRPLYIPLVPEAQAAPTAIRLADGSHLTVVAGRPRLLIAFAETGSALADQGGAWL